MEQMKYPKGVSDFRALVVGDYYFVDKTGLICDLCGTVSQTLFFTRPRRFGKTVNLSMIDHFFNIKYSDEEDIFEGLAVSKCERCAPYKHAYPVVKLNFGDLSGESVEMFRETLGIVISKAAMEIMNNTDPGVFNEYETQFLQRCIGSILSEAERRGSICILCSILKRIHRKNVLILVDEYDHCMQNIHSEEAFDAIVKFLRPFMEQTFKFNTDCEFAVVTGIMPLAKTSMLSSFNNANVCSILETEGDEYFGFTEDEVIRLIEKTGNPPEKISEIREWYDGYRFGNADVYNPYSVMMYLGNGCEPMAYWNNMTGGGMSEELVASMSAESLSALIELYESEGSSFETVLDTRISYSDVLSPAVKPSIVYSYLAMAGYLKALRIGTRDGFPLCRVSIVNKEVSTAFKRLVDRATEIEKRTANVMDCIYRKNAETLEELLESMLSGLCLDVSWSRLDSLSRHNRYRDVIMAYLMTPGQSARSEIPKGYGYTDIFFEKDKDHPAVIIEVKTTADPAVDLASLAEKALAQINEKGYSEDPDSKDAICVGLGIRQKSVKVAFAKE